MAATKAQAARVSEGARAIFRRARSMDALDAPPFLLLELDISMASLICMPPAPGLSGAVAERYRESKAVYDRYAGRDWGEDGEAVAKGAIIDALERNHRLTEQARPRGPAGECAGAGPGERRLAVRPAARRKGKRARPDSV